LHSPVQTPARGMTDAVLIAFGVAAQATAFRDESLLHQAAEKTPQKKLVVSNTRDTTAMSAKLSPNLCNISRSCPPVRDEVRPIMAMITVATTPIGGPQLL